MAFVVGARFLDRGVFFIAIVCLIALYPAYSQTPATIADQLSTAERVKKAGWWPTKGTPPKSEYSGAASCTKCHSEIATSQKDTHMAQTAESASTSSLLEANKDVRLTIGQYVYQILRKGADEVYSVNDGTNSVSDPLRWSFGTGNNGQSYLFEQGGNWYEARLSYYRAYDKFEITPNHPSAPAETLEKAIGRRISEDEAPKCFGCHTTASTTSGRFDPAHAEGGITCEVCHGPGAAHVAVTKSGMGEAGAGLVMNPAHLSPADSVDFCGACHRTWWDVNLAGLTGIGTLRFPAYRLEKSRCWGKGDARVTCIACHDPHKGLVKDSAAYDGRCLSCHVNAAGAKPTADHPGTACPVSTKDCASCHMPKYEVPDMHTKFTDHMIRVVKKDEVFRE